MTSKNGYNITELFSYEERILEAVSRLVPQLSGNIAVPTPEALAGIIASPDSHLFVIENEDKQIVGVLVLGLYRAISGHKAWIEDVIIDHSCRGLGLGKFIVSYAIEHARTLGADVVLLTSAPSRVAANVLYQKLGFVVKETNYYYLNLK